MTERCRKCWLESCSKWPRDRDAEQERFTKVAGGKPGVKTSDGADDALSENPR